MIDFIFWYLTITILGLIVFPIAYRLFPGLPDRGYSLSRILGLLIWGYFHWLLGILGLSRNDHGGLILALGISLGISLLMLYRRGPGDILAWVPENLRIILVVEVLFLTAFGGWAWVRSLNPEIMGTEKPMELAFINAVLRSETFPPHDPWLAGYSISYYYFGYLLVSMLAKLTGTVGSVAFNLGISLVFGLVSIGAYGLVYNLTSDLYVENKKQPLAPALLGPFFALIVSNWEGFLHFLHARGIFWGETGPGQGTSRFWRWLDIKDLVNPPSGDPFGHWWWWRASRVIKDIDFSGGGREVISEFPFFSFLLGDLHPHVLAMPFAFLVMGAALAYYRQRSNGSFRWLGILSLDLAPGKFFILAWIVGALGFLNTWDLPIYISLVAGVYTLRSLEKADEFNLWRTGLDFLSMAFSLGLTGILFYLPFYLGFSSQAGGIIPNALFVTRGVQLWVMFGPLFLPLFIYLGKQWFTHRRELKFGWAAAITLGLVFVLYALSTGIILGLQILPPLERFGSLEQVFLNSVGAGNIPAVIKEGFLRRLAMPGTLLTLSVLILLVIALWLNREDREGTPGFNRGGRFTLLLILGGSLLVLVPEFVFLRDLFGYRINTIFKFYYQAWLLWSAAAAFGTIYLFKNIHGGWNLGGQAVIILGLIMSLFYPVLALQSKTANFSREGGPTLDGRSYFESIQPFEAEAADWLDDQPLGVIAEAVGGSYSSSHARMATYTGMPTVLGWDFHEVQWRGGSELVNPRKNDIAELYCTTDWKRAEEIINQYDIRYLVVGAVEYSTYHPDSDLCPSGLQEEKFSDHLTTLFSNQTVTVYSPAGKNFAD
ncbi:MAG: DUF2298 domain-containing protein [Anaerolineales bacterium]|nr:DUF2298 domain-containing protein [Anaerolineales bacterium]